MLDKEIRRIEGKTMQIWKIIRIFANELPDPSRIHVKNIRETKNKGTNNQ